MFGTVIKTFSKNSYVDNIDSIIGYISVKKSLKTLENLDCGTHTVLAFVHSANVILVLWNFWNKLQYFLILWIALYMVSNKGFLKPRYSPAFCKKLVFSNHHIHTDMTNRTLLFYITVELLIHITKQYNIE